MRLLLLINDLMFVTGLRTQAQAAGWVVDSARDLNKYQNLTATDKISWDLVLFDLDSRANFELESNSELLSEILAGHALAFYSHMDQEAYQAGKELGFPQIIPRSKLNDFLSKALAGT